MPVLPIAGFLAAITQHRINTFHEEVEEKAYKPPFREYFTSDFDKTVDAHLIDRMYELKKQTNETAGIRMCAYLAACEVDKEIADELLAELNESVLHEGNYFNGDNWEWPLAAMEFKMEFCHRTFKKYGTCYWDELSKLLLKKS